MRKWNTINSFAVQSMLSSFPSSTRYAFPVHRLCSCCCWWVLLFCFIFIYFDLHKSILRFYFFNCFIGNVSMCVLIHMPKMIKTLESTGFPSHLFRFISIKVSFSHVVCTSEHQTDREEWDRQSGWDSWGGRWIGRSCFEETNQFG